MILVFNPERLSRKTTKAQWKEIWRWKRLTEQRIKKSVAEQIALLTAYGTTIPQGVRTDMIDVLVNPPLMIYPEPSGKYEIDLRPGAICYVR